MSWIALTPYKIKELEKMYMKKKQYIEVNIEYSGYKVTMRFDKKRLIEDFRYKEIENKLTNSPYRTLKELVQLQLLLELKDIIGSKDKHKLIMFG